MSPHQKVGLLFVTGIVSIAVFIMYFAHRSEPQRHQSQPVNSSVDGAAAGH